jgi:cell division initiation protein
LRLTPSDIYQREFKKAFRGLDQEDVEDFLDQVAEEYESILSENITLKQQVEALEERLGQTDSPEAVNEMIQEAKDKITKKIEEAEEEAEAIRQEAQEEAQKIIQEAKDKARDSRSQTNDAQNAIEIIEQATQDADKTIKDAKKQAEIIIQQAKMDAEAMVQEAEKKILELEAKKQDMESTEDIIQKANENAAQIIQKAKEEADMIISEAKDQLPQMKIIHKEDFEYPVFKDANPILNEVKTKSYAVIEKAKMEEMELKREIARLKNQKERYLMGYRELLNRQLKSLPDEAEE